MLESITSRLKVLAPKDGDYETDIPALTVHRRSNPTDPLPCVYELGLAITVAGHKQVTSGSQNYDYGPGEMLLASVELPVVSRVVQATPGEPYLGLMLRLDPRLAVQMSTELVVPPVKADSRQSALSKATLDEPLLIAVERLIRLLDEPELLNAVAPLIQKEIIARILMSPNGPLFLNMNAGGSPRHHVSQTMAWMKQHYMDSFTIEELAERAHMSASAYRSHFKSLSGVSPLQFVKQIRLQEARQLMLNAGLDASTACLDVGYESISQFNREYARLFGDPPLRDIKKQREAAV